MAICRLLSMWSAVHCELFVTAVKTELHSFINSITMINLSINNSCNNDETTDSILSSCDAPNRS